jgi:hypothetical protein
MPHLRLPQFRFTLRTFLIVCILPVPVLTWLANVKMCAVRQRVAIAQLQSQGFVHVRVEHPSLFWGVALIRRLVDQDAFDKVSVTNLNRPLIGQFWKPEDLEALTQLKRLRDRSFIHRSELGRVYHDQDRIRLPSDVLNRITTIRSLTSLCLDADLDEETQLKIAQLPELHSLYLPSTKVTSELLRVLGQSDKIASIDVDASLVTADGLEGLTQATGLQTLMLRQLPAEKQLLFELAKCKALTHLQLHSSRLTVKDAKWISDLPIQSLSLFHCELEPGFLINLKNSRTLAKLRILAPRYEGEGVGDNYYEGNLDKLVAREVRFALESLFELPIAQPSP